MSRMPNVRLALLLEAVGWGPSRFARALRKLADERGLPVSCHPTTVRRWLEGTQPRPVVAALILECLSDQLGRRITAQEAGLTRAPATVVDPSWEADPVHKLIQLTRSELDPDRRILLGTGAISLAAPLPPDGVALPRPPLLQAHPSRLRRRPGPTEADQMRAMASVFAAMADQYGGQRVRAALAAYLAHDVTPLLRAGGSDRVQRDILSATAQLSLLLGNTCADSDHQTAAQHYHQIAVRLAAEADDHTVLTIALRTMATHAHDLGNHSPAVLNLAEQAVHHARRATPVTHAYARAQLAVLQAHHDRHAAMRAYALAERLHSRGGTTPGPFTAYPPGALLFQRAHMLATLGDLGGTVAALTTSLRLRTPAERRAATLTRARLAETLLRLGHLDQALTHWHGFLEAFPTLHSAQAARRLSAMRQLLRPHLRHRPAADLLAQVDGLA
ncbi:hypothetical protein AB0L99_05750 [Streptomyces sp. NPDC051954]|uniref:hypothetical protein n=1 Tax=Streptomyces sp. NPDC051954 TaxID=3155524 RepID=UPI0034464DC9